MSTPLKETYIEKVAINYLTEHYYTNCSHNNKIQYKLQAYTVDNKRADGIIVWEKAPNQIRLVSIEAKSSKTISNLKSRWNKEQLSETSLILAEVVVFALFALLYGLFLIRIPLDGPAVLLILLFIYLSRIPLRILLQNLFASYFKTASVFEQVNLYPGNEVWIAIGYDTFKANKEQKLREFIAECKRRKLGLLEIQEEDEEPQVLLRPKFKPNLKRKDFLQFYKLDSKLRQSISGPPNIRIPRITRSKAEIRFYINQFFYAMSIVVCLFFFTGSFRDLPQRSKNNPTLEVVPYSYIVEKEETQPIIEQEETMEEVIEQEEIIEDFLEQEETIEEEIPDNPNIPPPCIFPFEGKKFIVKDKIVTSFEDAQERTRLLKHLGFKDSNYFYIPCSTMTDMQETWCVYAYNPRSSKEIATDYLRKYKYILRVNELDSSESEIWYIEGG